MERAIGTRITLEVVEQKGIACEGCFLNETDCCHFGCMADYRSDHKNIIYKEIKGNESTGM